MVKKETVLSVVKEIRNHLKSRFPHTPVLKPEAIVSNEGRFVRNSYGTVTDKQLKLIWYPTMAKQLTWEEAKKECEKLGCRLPTTKELYSLVDVSKYEPAIDKEIFPDTKSDYYWTSDVCAWDAGYAWYVDFSGGRVGGWYKGDSVYVRAVRSSQCRENY